MLYPPSAQYTPGEIKLQNGRPVLATDVQEVDRWATWLASQRKYGSVCALSVPWDLSGGSHAYLAVWVPPYTQWIAICLTATGQGTVTVTADSDIYPVDVGVGGTLNDTGIVDHAREWWSGSPVAVGGGSSNLQRSPEVDFIPTWQLVKLDVTSTDSIWLHGVRVLPLAAPYQALT